MPGLPELQSGRTTHAAGVARLLESYRAVPPTATVRLAKPTSNLFRGRHESGAAGLDTSGLAHPGLSLSFSPYPYSSL